MLQWERGTGASHVVKVNKETIFSRDRRYEKNKAWPRASAPPPTPAHPQGVGTLTAGPGQQPGGHSGIQVTQKVPECNWLPHLCPWMEGVSHV